MSFGEFGQRIDFRMPIVLRCLEQFPDFGGKQIVFAFLVVQEMSEAPLGETEAIPRSDVEIAYAYLPCSFERALGILVGMLVELISKGHPAESEAKLLLVDLCARLGMLSAPLSFRFGQNDGIQKRFPSLSRRERLSIGLALDRSGRRSPEI